jgi:hypothetical protein
LRPMATKITMQSTSATADHKTTFDFMTSPFVDFFDSYDCVVIGDATRILIDSSIN